MKGVLDLAMKAANMQWEVTQDENREFKIGEQVNYTVNLKSTGIATMYSVNFGLKLPSLLSKLNTDITASYYKNGILVGSPFTISKSQLNTQTGDPFLLETIITTLKSSEEGFVGNSNIVLKFGVIT